MKRSDIKAGPVYGYNESTSHIYRCSPVVVLSTDLYQRRMYGSDRSLKRADQYHTAMTTGRGGLGLAAVGLLVVFLSFTLDTDDYEGKLARLRKVATAEAALEGLNGDGTDVHEGGVVLGRYGLLTNQRYLHGDYRTLQAQLDEADRQRQEYADEAEQSRLARVETAQGLAARLTKLGITGYHVGRLESPTRFEALSFEDMDILVTLAERGDNT